MPYWGGVCGCSSVRRGGWWKPVRVQGRDPGRSGPRHFSKYRTWRPRGRRRVQTGPAGFDDLRVSVELLGGGNRTVHVQCRHRQPFTASDVKFRNLIAQAAAAVRRDVLSFATGERRFAVIVDSRSPGHASMTMLCDLARDPGDLDRFLSVVGAHGDRREARWQHLPWGSRRLRARVIAPCAWCS